MGLLGKVKSLISLLFVIWGIFIQTNTFAQYGDRNKPGYKIFTYKVYKTPHFEIYHYFESDSTLVSIAETAEKWYLRHQMIFKDTFKTPNPLIIYANHADFQQTSAIGENIGVGTGGVTEALKNRVIMPMMESAAQTDHVLGHELVHAFQYRILLSDDSLQQRNPHNIPLWMVEGLAEYMSIGSYDPNTSMWMRDAILNNDFPSLEDMSKSYKYFPYRYGQAFWAYITGLHGDTIIKPLFDLTTRIGYDKALDSIIHQDEDTFSTLWKKNTTEYYKQFFPDSIEKPVGNKILYSKNSGDVNIAPSISPDGKYLVYLSEKDVFSLDLYLADAHTGKVIKQLSSTVRENNIDDFNYLESGGSWSPDGKKFVFVIFSQGKNKLLLVDVNKPRRTEEVELPGLDAFSNPSWSPDGNTIIVTGLVEGVTDLYAYSMNKQFLSDYRQQGKLLRKITNDNYANIQPSWSVDGNYITYATDKPYGTTDTSTSSYRIAIMDVKTDETKVLPIFPGADNLNPQFSPDGKWVYFVSTADGFRNLYKYSLDSNKVYRLTQILTGVSGITPFTPAYSIDRSTGNLIYTHYYNSKYSLYQENISDFKVVEVDPKSVNFMASYLPPYNRTSINIVNTNINNIPQNPSFPVDSFSKVPFKSKFKLDYIGNSGGMSVGVSSYYGAGMSGSIDMLFSDIVGHYQMYTSLSINGEIYDFGGIAAFINNRKQVDWGVSLSHIPYRYGEYFAKYDSLSTDTAMIPIIARGYNIIRLFEEKVSLFATYPFTQTQRFEAEVSTARYSYRIDKYSQYFDESDENYLGEDYKRNIPAPSGFNISQVSLAYNMDNSYMGIASPLRGQRLRISGEQYFGEVQFPAFMVNYCRYLFIKPITIAARAFHYGRYGNIKDSSVFYPMYIGYPWFVRGYDNFFWDTKSAIDQETRVNQLYGNRIAVGNIEIRLPFTGPERLCLIPSKMFFSELALFVDAGLAYNKEDKVNLDITADMAQYKVPMLSYGISLRINIFGMMVLEPYYAIPIQKDGFTYASFGLNFMPGW
jgi:Tol biopolymer transport system component